MTLDTEGVLHSEGDFALRVQISLAEFLHAIESVLLKVVHDSDCGQPRLSIKDAVSKYFNWVVAIFIGGDSRQLKIVAASRLDHYNGFDENVKYWGFVRDDEFVGICPSWPSLELSPLLIGCFKT